MTQSIIEMAREAGMSIHTDDRPYMEMLQHFAQLIRADVLEELETKVPGGKYTDKWESSRIADCNQGWNDYRKQCAAAIRQLKETK